MFIIEKKKKEGQKSVIKLPLTYLLTLLTNSFNYLAYYLGNLKLDNLRFITIKKIDKKVNLTYLRELF